MREGTDDLYIVIGEKFGQCCVVWEQEDREVATIHHVLAHSARALDQLSKIRVQLRRPSGDVDSGYVRRAQDLEAFLQDVTRHHFGAVGSGVYVAMAAGLIALLADVDLEDIDTGGAEWIEARLGEGCLERPREWNGGERGPLLGARGQRRVLLCKCG